MSMTELALVESKALREQHMDHADVLDKVKSLIFLPDGVNATTEMAASYFEVGIEAIKSVVKDHLDEVEADGRRVVEGEELRSLKDLCGLDPRTRSLALFPRRALLRLGMLLRDSEIAKQVRTAILDREAGSSRMPVPRSFAQALRLAADLQEQNDAQRAALEVAAPKAAYVDNFLRNDDTCLLRQLAKRIGFKERDLREELLTRRVIFRTPIGRFSESKGREVTEYRYEPTTAYMGWFRECDQPNAPRHHNGQLRTTLYVTPAGKVGIARMLGRLDAAPFALEGATA
jgi:hypothetical protein